MDCCDNKWSWSAKRLYVTHNTSVQFSSVAQSCSTLCNPMDFSTPGFHVHHQLPEFIQIHVYWVGDAIQPSHPLSSPSLLAFHLSQHQGLFQWVSSSHQVARVLEFQFQHQSFQWIFRLISFRIDWFDFLAIQGTLKSLLQHHSSKASILWCSVFFMVQLSHPYMTTGKTIALTRWTLVSKVMCLLFNILSRLLCLVAQSCLILCNTMDYRPPGPPLHGDSPGKNTAVGCHTLLQRIFPTQGSNPGLPHCRWILYHLSHQGNLGWS